jgi:hypothetical protein
LLLVGGVAVGQLGVPLNRSEQNLEPAQIRELVARYCRTDFAGARLNPADWPKLQPIVSWRSDPDFPVFAVTSRFDVDPALVSEHGKYTVNVRYRLLGTFNLTEGYSDESFGRVENVAFTVGEINGDWRITEVQPGHPHVSKAAALQWINAKLAATQDPATKMIYQHAIDVLDKQNASPFAK